MTYCPAHFWHFQSSSSNVRWRVMLKRIMDQPSMGSNLQPSPLNIAKIIKYVKGTTQIKTCHWHSVSSTVEDSSQAHSGCENHPEMFEKHHREIVNSYICSALDARSYCLHIWRMCFWVVTSGVQKQQVCMPQCFWNGSICREQKLKSLLYFRFPVYHALCHRNQG